MMHKTRSYSVVPVETAERLADILAEHTWCSCNAFAFAGLIFANDSTGPDGAQEYAIVKDGTQIESITFGWCDRAKALDYITQLAAGTLGTPYCAVTNTFETPEQHGSCWHCA